MINSTNPNEEELWNTHYNQWMKEKEDLRKQQLSLDKADNEYYKRANLILKFCQHASSIFIKSSADEKRLICEVIGSNFIANGKNIDITLHSAIYDIIDMVENNAINNGRFELTENQTGIKKEPSKKALDLNGGADEARTRDLLRDRQTL